MNKRILREGKTSFPHLAQCSISQSVRPSVSLKFLSLMHIDKHTDRQTASTEEEEEYA